jgi:glycosyltransferase involved in cell wall biosynthesis
MLTFTSLYPNAEQPRHGIFIENRIRELKRSHPVDVTVVAPVPWFPFSSPRMGRYATYARVAPQETRHGITVYHPRYLVVPKIGMNIAPGLMYRSLRRFVRRLHEQHRFDVLDGHFLYPDGVVATRLGRDLGLPVMNTARGTDVVLYTTFPVPRRHIRRALRESEATIGVCEFLARRLRELEPAQGNIVVLRNGVDLEHFREQDRGLLRERFKLSRFTLLSVGNLIELKGHHLIIEAMQELPDCELLIAGEGPMEPELRRLVARLGLEDRVRMLGLIPHEELRELYSAADCLVLASRSEGWANVLLESMACGTPVLATAVGGTPEVVADERAGLLLEQRTAAAVADGVRKLRRHYPDRGDVRRYASAFSWQETSAALYALAARLADARAVPQP